MKYKVVLKDKEGNKVNPLINKVLGTGNGSVKAKKELKKASEAMFEIMSRIVDAGVEDIDIQEAPEKEVKTEKPIPKARKRRVVLTKTQRAALRKDRNKLSVFELMEKYNVSKDAVYKLIR